LRLKRIALALTFVALLAASLTAATTNTGTLQLTPQEA
jgi:hypothetical protein